MTFIIKTSYFFNPSRPINCHLETLYVVLYICIGIETCAVTTTDIELLKNINIIVKNLLYKYIRNALN